MNIPSINIDGREVCIVDKSVIQDLVYAQASEFRKEIKTGHCKLKEALEILGCGATKFQKLYLKDPKCKIKKSPTNGKYLRASIYAELERLTRIKNL